MHALGRAEFAGPLDQRLDVRRIGPGHDQRDVRARQPRQGLDHGGDAALGRDGAAVDE
ncbi:hypothetical protein HNR73_001056 [Phytomonospora endophytica]|uniref:Uncharacterized protein n=1 Tax=Phytomonospora endophytica TaxID=714109 RepID=A0A841FKP1_9ACTN|nr:hypothetical protein [Phytomonospora endophytica]GIG65436.1 hypothetical protein Pen01_17310 [Phytomonospora endophytica]